MATSYQAAINHLVFLKRNLQVSNISNAESNTCTWVDLKIKGSSELSIIPMILCLHGYRQNEKSFRERTGSFRKIIKKHAELVFISAPNRVPPIELPDGEQDDQKSDDQRGWWFSTTDSTYHAHDYTDCVKGYKESVDVIKQAFQEHVETCKLSPHEVVDLCYNVASAVWDETKGPFDGVLAFSQGAAMLSLICGMKEQNIENFEFDFVILVAGFKSRQKPHEDLYKTIITIPSLHVFGDTDKVIDKEMSEDLLQYYKDPKVLQHIGGHFIPASGPQKTIYIEFLDSMLARKKEKLSSQPKS